MRDYGKLMWAIIGAVAYFLQAALRDGMTGEEWIGTAIAAVNAVVVWMAPDMSIAPWVKSWIGALLAGLLVAETAVVGGFTTDEWFGIIIAILTAAGVVADPRRPVRAVSTVARQAPNEAY
jgi:energy-converting hydrogenase Eha subunit B